MVGPLPPVRRDLGRVHRRSAHALARDEHVLPSADPPRTPGSRPGRDRLSPSPVAHLFAEDGARRAAGPVLVLRDARQPLGGDRARAHPSVGSPVRRGGPRTPGTRLRHVPLLGAPARRPPAGGPARRGGRHRLSRHRAGPRRRNVDRLDVRRRRPGGVLPPRPTPRVGGRSRPRRNGGRPDTRGTDRSGPRPRGRRPPHDPRRGPGGGRARRPGRLRPATAERGVARPRRSARPPPVGTGDPEAPRPARRPSSLAEGSP